MGDHELNSVSPDQVRLPSLVFLTPDDSTGHMHRRHSRVCIAACVITLLGVGCFIAGVVLISLAQKETSITTNESVQGLNQTKLCSNYSSISRNESKAKKSCEFSMEAKRAGELTN